MQKLFPLFLCGIAAFAQEPNPTQRLGEPNVQQDTGGPTPIYRITVVSRTARAVSYRHRSGSTKVDFRGTELMPQARGEAKVNGKNGYIEVDADFEHLDSPTKFGPEYLTYVLWAITPEGRATNLGEVLLNGSNKSKLDVTTELQAFALVVTAEPYFGVTQPSDVVVMENEVRSDTKGKVEEVDAKYELLKRGQYSLNQNVATIHPVQVNPNVPVELFEAQNAVRIARWAGAEKYAPDTFAKARDLLNQAENYQARKVGSKPVIMTAREAVQTAENARILALRREREEALAQERQAAADREAAERAKAEQAALDRQRAEEQQKLEAERRAQAEQQRAQADQQRAQAEADRTRALADRAAADAARTQAESERQAAERAKAEAEQAAQAAAQAKAEAEAARSAALAEQQRLSAEADRSRQQAQEADRMRQQAESDRDRIRQQLLTQLNMVLETRESARGLIVNMSDVLFDFGKSTLKPGAREKLAKIAGIVLAHPGLNLEVEGHTDAVGSDAFNQKLSEARADAVRDYLVNQGLKSEAVTAKGLGKTQPVASNDTPEGRQRNRRVELVVSGDVIGTKIQSMRLQTQPVNPPQQQ